MMVIKILSLFAFVLLINLHPDTGFAYRGARIENPTVNTTKGPVEGIALDAAKVFFGIPYATPPTGNLRWKSPVEALPWTPKVYQAKKPPPGCPQTECKEEEPQEACPETTNEDCLYLTIFAPLNATEKSSLPVMVFLHGGNFRHTSAYSLLTDSRFLANRTNTVVVLPNYRLGALGFLVTDTGSDGNFGIHDQRLALRWVQNNIRNFGGNPNMVTLFGQSAGAQSTAIHLTSLESSNLFHRAIMESLPFGIPLKTRKEAIALGNYFAKFLNCSKGDLECMRSKSVEDIVIAQNRSKTEIVNPFSLLDLFEPWTPSIDGYEIKDHLADAFIKGHFQTNIPIIIGVVSEEIRIFIYEAFNKPASLATYLAMIIFDFPAASLKILERYPPQTGTSDYRDQLCSVGQLAIFACPTEASARSVQERQPNVWLYLFDHAMSFGGWDQFTYCDGHVCHAGELPFVFSTAVLGNYTFTKDEEFLSSSLMYYWGNFAYTGNPNNHDSGGKTSLLPIWPTFSNESGFSIIKFQTPQNQITKGYDCQFWDSLNIYP